MTDSERELRRLFEELRRADEISAPSFKNILDRARAGGERTHSVPFLRALPFALVLAVIAVSWIVLRGPRRGPAPAVPEEPPRAVALADWKSPTDFLLKTPGAELLNSTPALTEPLPDYSQRQFLRTEKGVRS